jgi:hypothetical protein
LELVSLAAAATGAVIEDQAMATSEAIRKRGKTGRVARQGQVG